VRDAAGDVVRLVPGGELSLEQLDRPLDELRRFALAGNPRYLLVETPYYGWPLDLPARLFTLRTAGITPVLAHPERNASVQDRPELLDDVVRGGTLVQLTAGSVDGRLGGRARKASFTLLEYGLAHLIASDAHAPTLRAIGMSGAARAVGDDELAHWLTVDVPRAIVEDERLPQRPQPPRRGGFLTRLRG
jgi:protein-tyrosine phosphatase